MITEVTWKDPWTRRVLLFQSVPQMLSWLACVLAVYLVVVVIARLAHATTVNPRYFIVGFLGTLPSLYGTLPCVFSVSGADRARIEEAVDRFARRMGYVGMPAGRGEKAYRSKLPRLLRWDENVIRLAADGSDIRIQAPKIVAARLRQAIAGPAGPM